MRTNARRPRSRSSPSPSRFYGLLGIGVGLALAVVGVVALDLPLYLAWIIGMSVSTLALYGFDKRRAISRSGRVPESVLHGLALLGGFPGGWVGRAVFRHKTRHLSFLVVLLLATAIHAALGYWLLA